jgi:cytochrome P450
MIPASPAPRRRRLAELTGLTPLTDTTTCPDPQAAYQRLIQQWGIVAPVQLEPGINAWLVLGHPEIAQVVGNELLYSRDPHHWREFTEGTVAADSGLGPMMFPRPNAYFSDGPLHRRLRAPLVEGLAGLDQRRISHSIRTICADLIDGLVEGFASGGRADLLADYAAAIPMLAVADWFGINADDRQRLREGLIALFGSGQDSQDGYMVVQQILTDVMHARRAQPAADLTTAFVQHPNLGDDDEVMQSMLLMIAAGYETTTTWIARTLQLMLTDPRFAASLRGGRLGVDEALDEVLWRDPPMANMPARYALTDTELAGQPISRGDALILGFAAANADPRVHTGDPWLEIGNRSHLAWSAGPHVCPAHQPARLITRIAVETALHQLPGVTLAIPADQISVLPSPWTRCPATLPVTFTVPRPKTPTSPHTRPAQHAGGNR